MKKILFLTLLMAVGLHTKAQSYSELKKTYDYRTYYPKYTDSFNPAIAGVCSFIMPGLGQIVCDQPMRGLAFMGGTIATMMLTTALSISAATSNPNYHYDSYNNTGDINGVSAGILVLGITTTMTIYIWSIVDAVRVAKVMNLYYRDKFQSNIKVQVSPFITQIPTHNGLSTPVGLKVGITF